MKKKMLAVLISLSAASAAQAQEVRIRLDREEMVTGTKIKTYPKTGEAWVVVHIHSSRDEGSTRTVKVDFDELTYNVRNETVLFTDGAQQFSCFEEVEKKFLGIFSYTGVVEHCRTKIEHKTEKVRLRHGRSYDAYYAIISLEYDRDGE